ncbi:MAG: tetratricopeptide repeat protein, partial [Casimicrobiaceae bacterium]
LLFAVEPTLMAQYGWTPGKWLLGLYAVSGVTQVGARPRREVHAAARRRAWQVAWYGLAMGFLPATVLLLKRHWVAMRDNEPRWDAASDSVILARPVAWLPATSAALIVLATLLLAATLWTRNAISTWQEFSTWWAARRPASTAVSATNVQPAQPSPPVDAESIDGTRSVTITSRPAEGAPRATTNRSPETKAPPIAGRPEGDADSQIARQAAVAQSRRARIERAEAAVAAVRRGQGTYGPLQTICQRWTEDQPGSAEAWRCLGLAQYQNGAGPAALPALRTALRLNPKDPEIERTILMILRPQ